MGPGRDVAPAPAPPAHRLAAAPRPARALLQGESVLGPDALLAAWESAAGQHPLDRALTMLQAAYPGRSRDELARLTIGERDALLFGIYADNFGPRLTAHGFCPECASHVELDLDVDDLPLFHDTAAAGTVEVQAGELLLTCRPPDSYDLAAIVGSADPVTGSRMLLERCVVQLTQGETPVGVSELTEEQVAALSGAVADALDEAQPLANLQVLITCPTCGHVWDLLLDIVDFLWVSIERQSRRLLSEVDVLARAYGWREADVLALSPARREMYLEMAGG